ncbi:thioredoxin-like protein [Sparassis latifolia]|uniref:Thioredoxin-like protein n=1 Tax=Sparassis crispa TaxID=139825 RepID=A0A401H0S6_9APHY|nr:thioredoxin-like protein [Sparassis crispa]GBE88018.1 thioredoxin-like protein [Sparassis crispa]
MAAIQPRVVSLVVISDMICPWCYVGHRELTLAIEAVADLPITIKVEHRPYRLQPSLKDDQCIVKREWYLERFGKEKSSNIEQLVTARAKQLGLNINYEGTITQTTRAHRLSLKAWKLGGQATQEPFINAIHKAYFEDCKNIGDFEVLGELAEASGVMSKAEAVKFLESDECLEEVEEMSAEARRKGVTGVPFTIVDGRWAVIGGQTSEVYIEIFKKLAQTEKGTPLNGVPAASTCLA